MTAGMLLLNQVLNNKEKQRKQLINNNNNDNNTMSNTYFTDIRDIKGNLKGVKNVKT